MAARHIVCFGNPWHGDDGFGIRVYEQLRQRDWPEDVRVYEAGISGLEALRHLETCELAILVDALAGDGPVGAVRVLRPQDLAAGYPPRSSHELGLAYLLQALPVIREPMPELWIVGAEVAQLAAFTPGLSPAVEQAVIVSVRVIQDLLAA